MERRNIYWLVEDAQKYTDARIVVDVWGLLEENQQVGQIGCGVVTGAMCVAPQNIVHINDVCTVDQGRG